LRTLILPNVVALSDTQCKQLEAYVRNGGGLVATHATSLCDEWGIARTNFGLADLFGVDFAGRIDPRMQNTYLALNHAAPAGQDLLKGLETAPRIIHGVSRVEVSPQVAFPPAPLTLIPSYPDLPMEKVYPRNAATDIAQVFVREHGRGRVVYFPWDIDRTFWEVLCVDHGKLLRNAVDWATREEPPVTVTGPGVLDVTVWRQKDSLTVHLVNLTNPMMMKGPVRELIAIGPQRVRVRLPAGAKSRGVHLLAAGQAVSSKRAGEFLLATVPSVLDHEVVAIDLG